MSFYKSRAKPGGSRPNEAATAGHSIDTNGGNPREWRLLEHVSDMMVTLAPSGM